MVLLAAAGGSLSLLAVSFWFRDANWFKTGTLLFVVLCAILQLVSGALATRRGQAGAWLFFAGALAVISSVLFGIIGYLNPGNVLVEIAGI